MRFMMLDEHPESHGGESFATGEPARRDPTPRMLRAALVAAALLPTAAALADAQATGRRVTVNGMQMYYEESGEGEPLVVLHGAYMNIPSMGAIIAMLARTHRVYAVELQGHGRTGDIDRPITYPNLADDVAAFMDAVGLPRADVFGYSMGAAAGLQLAIRHPAKVNRLVAASAAYDARGWQPEFTAMIPQFTVDMLVGTPLEREYRKLAPDPDVIGQAELLHALIEPFLRGETPKGMFGAP
jgi:pimeloyl-ACP methyl ester carboxylesterase